MRIGSNRAAASFGSGSSLKSNELNFAYSSFDNFFSHSWMLLDDNFVSACNFFLFTSRPTGLLQVPCCPVYAATKHGVIGFTRAMAVSRVYSRWCVWWVCVCVCVYVCFSFPSGSLFRSGLWHTLQRSLPVVHPNWAAVQLSEQTGEIFSVGRWMARWDR